MESEWQDEGGAKTELNKKEAELKEETSHDNLKGTWPTCFSTENYLTQLKVNVNSSSSSAINGVTEGAEEVTSRGETLPNRDRGGGDLSSINAMMSTVMSAAGTLNGGGGGDEGGDGGSGGTSANSSAGPSPRWLQMFNS